MLSPKHSRTHEVHDVLSGSCSCEAGGVVQSFGSGQFHWSIDGSQLSVLLEWAYPSVVQWSIQVACKFARESSSVVL